MLSDTIMIINLLIIMIVTWMLSHGCCDASRTILDIAYELLLWTNVVSLGYGKNHHA